MLTDASFSSDKEENMEPRKLMCLEQVILLIKMGRLQWCGDVECKVNLMETVLEGLC